MMRVANPGNFDFVLAFYQPAQTTNPTTGEKVTTYTRQPNTVRAEEVMMRGNERMEAEQLVGSTIRQFRCMDIRSLYPVSQTWQLEAFRISAPTELKRYSISAVDDEGRKNYIKITCEYRDNNGT